MRCVMSERKITLWSEKEGRKKGRKEGHTVGNFDGHLKQKQEEAKSGSRRGKKTTTNERVSNEVNLSIVETGIETRTSNLKERRDLEDGMYERYY